MIRHWRSASYAFFVHIASKSTYIHSRTWKYIVRETSGSLDIAMQSIAFTSNQVTTSRVRKVRLASSIVGISFSSSFSNAATARMTATQMGKVSVSSHLERGLRHILCLNRSSMDACVCSSTSTIVSSESLTFLVCTDARVSALSLPFVPQETSCRSVVVDGKKGNMQNQTAVSLTAETVDGKHICEGDGDEQILNEAIEQAESKNGNM